MTNIIGGLFDKTMHGVNKALDLQWRRNQAIASNIANSETPQYRASDLNFAGELDRAFNVQQNDMMSTNSKHMDLDDRSSAHLVPDYRGATKADGNNVDLDIEMGRLAKNTGLYSMSTEIIRKKLQMVRYAIQRSER